jgi:hypothetical protein
VTAPSADSLPDDHTTRQWPTLGRGRFRGHAPEPGRGPAFTQARGGSPERGTSDRVLSRARGARHPGGGLDEGSSLADRRAGGRRLGRKGGPCGGRRGRGAAPHQRQGEQACGERDGRDEDRRDGVGAHHLADGLRCAEGGDEHGHADGQPDLAQHVHHGGAGRERARGKGRRSGRHDGREGEAGSDLFGLNPLVVARRLVPALLREVNDDPPPRSPYGATVLHGGNRGCFQRRDEAGAMDGSSGARADQLFAEPDLAALGGGAFGSAGPGTLP